MDLLFVIIIVLYVSIRIFLLRRKIDGLEASIEYLEAYKQSSYQFIERMDENFDECKEEIKLLKEEPTCCQDK